MSSALRVGALLLAGAVTWTGCNFSKDPAPSVTTAAPAPVVAPAPETAAPQPTVVAGERAPVVVDGDTVRVNNRLCGVSRGAMGPETLGQFVSRVTYVGADPRFRGKTFEFNQCCGGCVQTFPEMWAQRADEILAFHGVDLPR